jgi:3-hydroxymyristoyl/3-hydroxydecanoyl-(acyl carrier protein) dehydratase
VRADAEPWRMQPGGSIVAEYDVGPDDWYFAAERQPAMPFAVVLETALQSCGFLAAYMGSALTSADDLHFRNLGGQATLLRPVGADAGTLATTVKVTGVSSVGGMIIQNYDFEVRDRAGLVYRGKTYFGFFTNAALAQQVGIREATLIHAHGLQPVGYPQDAPFPDRMLRMIDRIDHHDPAGGPHGQGFIQGSKRIDPAEWFFQAHFHQDPVWPGSLGLEAFVQLLKYACLDRFKEKGGGGHLPFAFCLPSWEHRWSYRGQVLPGHQEVVVQALLTAVDEVESSVRADGWLAVDGRVIYQLNDFGMRLA